MDILLCITENISTYRFTTSIINCRKKLGRVFLYFQMTNYFFLSLSLKIIFLLKINLHVWAYHFHHISNTIQWNQKLFHSFSRPFKCLSFQTTQRNPLWICNSKSVHACCNNMSVVYTSMCHKTVLFLLACKKV